MSNARVEEKQNEVLEEERRISQVGFKALVRTLLKHKLSRFGLIVIFLLILMAVLAPVIAPYHPNDQDLYQVLKGPSKEHWLGTDNVGRDLLSRILYGAQISMTAATFATLGSIALGIIMGLIAGFKGGIVDNIIMRMVDTFMVFPGLIFILIMAAALGPGIKNVIIAIILFGWTWAARVIRGQVLAVREHPYVEAAKAAGASEWRVMLKHVLPNSIAPMIVATALGMGGAVGMEAGAAFLGIGVQPPTPSWGRALRTGYSYLERVPLFSIAPGVLITLAVLSFTLLGDGLRDALDPRIRGEGKKIK
ncbi:MAG: ABC transporter permease [Candidatus Adiutricales bacterium]|jgi:ABC-type dipeptide/oligopeptide/nickel transport system permease subunit